MGQANRLMTAVMMVLLTLIEGCSMTQLYETLIGWEREAAGLTPDSMTIDGQHVVFLRNESANDGPALVLVHGFGANKDNWLRMAAELTADYNVYVIDLPGHGESDKSLERDYGVEAQVAVLQSFADKLSLGRVHWAGNSMGGGIVSFLARRHPEQTASLTLLSPAGIFRYPSELDRALEQGNNPLIVKEPGDFDDLMDFVLEKRPFIPWPIPGVLEQRAMDNRAVNEKIFADIRASAENYDLASLLTEIRAPALILWGEHERVLDVRNAEVFEQQIPDARLQVLEGVGHVPMLEEPEATARRLDDFITSLES